MSGMDEEEMERIRESGEGGKEGKKESKAGWKDGGNKE